MSDQPQRQHCISKFLIKQWAQDGDIGVVSMYHRDSATVSATARTLHSVVDLWSRDLESSWSDAESDANDAIDKLREALEPGGDDFAAAQRVLSEPKNRRSLIDLAVLHHARSVAVAVRQFARQHGAGDGAETEAMIRARWDDAQDYYKCGIVVSVLPRDSSVALGAAPVFNTPSWGGPRAGASALFMMPVTPRVVIAGDPELPPDQFKIELDRTDRENRLKWQLAAEPGLFATPFLICEPSAVEQTAKTALALTEGTPIHWLALRDRIALHDEATRKQLTAWRRLISDQEDRQGWHDDPLTSNSMRTKHRRAMAANAREIQAALDSLGVDVCDCKKHRGEGRDATIAALWQALMPQAVCEAIRRKRNTASGRYAR
ncbi:MAG: hypothetical protein OXG76_13380 [Acidimicrobiaceae bacterium]|nr:hypothetical protein [Acidimicrobiaceae bacterium]